MTDLSNEIRADIKASLLIYLQGVLAGDPPATIDDITADFAKSGEETRKEWVIAVVNDLLLDGVIAGTLEPHAGVVEPSQQFIERERCLKAANLFPSDKTSIERIPWQAPEPGNPTASKPSWRLVVWQKQTVGGHEFAIKDVVQSDKLAQILPLAPWAIIWHAKVVNEALKMLAPKAQVDLTQATARDSATYKLRVYSDSIRAVRLTDDVVFEYSPVTMKWTQL